MTMRVVLLVLAGLAAVVAEGCGRQQPAGPSLTPEARPFTNVREYGLAARFSAGVQLPKALAAAGRKRTLVAGAGEVAELGPSGKQIRLIVTGDEAHCVAPSEDGGFYLGLRQRVDQYDRNGVKSRSWGRPGGGDGGLGHVTSIAVSGHNVLVADALNRVVHRFDTTGDYITYIGGRGPSGAPGIITPSMYLDCAVNVSNEVVIGNPGRLRVEVYDLNGNLLRKWGAGGAAPDRFCPCCNPIHLAIGPGGEVVTVEKGLPRVKVHDASGHLLAVLGVHSARAAGHSVPDAAPSDAPVFGDVAVDEDGRILVIYSPASEVWVFEPAPANGAEP